MSDERRWRDENRFDRDEWDRSRYDAWRGAGREHLSWGRGAGTHGGQFGDSYPYYRSENQDPGHEGRYARDDWRASHPGSDYGRFGYGRDYGAPPYRGYGRDDFARDAYGRPWGPRRPWDPPRGLLERAADEVSSWFGDDEAMHRRELDAQGAQGAQGSNRRGRGPKGYIRSDERIREDVCDRLSDDPVVDASEVDVAVASGEVTLTGTVTSREERRRAEECAERVSGVTHVQNNLRVPRGGTTLGQTTPAQARTTGSIGRNDTGRPAH